MKKYLAIVLALAMMLSLGVAAAAASDDFDYSGYEPGVTVIEDASSPTGYRAVFIYDSNKVVASDLGLVDIVSVGMYSDCMKLYTYEEQESGKISGAYGHMPDEYTEGMYPGGGNGETRLDVQLEDLGGGFYGCNVALPSGAFVYNFQLTDSEGTVKARLSDPSNPAAFNEKTGISDLSSMLYVPYSADTMNSDEWADRSLELPKTEGAKGTYIETSYKGVNGEIRGLCVYLPAGYDKNREEPYNVLYISHGAGADLRGEEMRWMNEGCVVNIMDNLGAQWVVVSMNNQDMDGWKYGLIENDQFNHIMPYVEANFNVATDASGRAYAGLSMGGITTSNMFMNHTSEFGWYGIWSAANAGGLDATGIKEALSAIPAEDRPEILFAYGSWDFGMASCNSFADGIAELGYDFSKLEVPGAHDWETWQLIYAWAAQNFFFQ